MRRLGLALLVGIVLIGARAEAQWVGAASGWVRADLGAAGGSGTVTSVGNGTIGPLFSATWATATTTPALSLNLAAQSANCVVAGPGTGAAAVPTCRSLVAADLGTALSVQFTAVQATTFTGALTGNASTATALAADPTACGAGQYVSDMTAAGVLTCGTPAGGSPGGATTLLQYNNAGAFGGALGSAVTAANGAIALTQQDVAVAPLALVGKSGETAPALTITGGATPGASFTSFVNVTGTFPASPSAAVAGLDLSLTGAGSAAQQQYGFRITNAAGYTGSKLAAGIVIFQSSKSTGTAPVGTNGGNIGEYIETDAGSAAGTAVGLSTYVGGSTGVNIGTLGDVNTVGVAGTYQVGVAGRTSGAASGGNAGGYFRIGTPGSVFPAFAKTAALIGDNGTAASPPFIAIDNTATVFSVEDSGYLTAAVGSAGNAAWGVPSGTPQAYTHTMAASATGTDVAGASATITSGAGRGNGATSQIAFQTPTRGVTGSTAQTQATRQTITSSAIVGAAPNAFQLTADATVQVGQVVMADAGTDGRFDVNTGSGTTAIGVLAPTSNGASAAGTAYGIAFGGVAYVAQAEDQTVTRAHFLVQSATAGYVDDSATIGAAGLTIAKSLYSEAVTAAILPAGCTGSAGCINTALNTPNAGPAGQITLAVDVAALGWAVGDPVIFWNSGGTTPTGLGDGLVYYLTSVSTTNVLIAATKGGATVVPSSQGDDATQYLARLPQAVIHIQ